MSYKGVVHVQVITWLEGNGIGKAIHIEQCVLIGIVKFGYNVAFFFLDIFELYVLYDRLFLLRAAIQIG